MESKSRVTPDRHYDLLCPLFMYMPSRFNFELPIELEYYEGDKKEEARIEEVEDYAVAQKLRRELQCQKDIRQIIKNARRDAYGCLSTNNWSKTEQSFATYNAILNDLCIEFYQPFARAYGKPFNRNLSSDFKTAPFQLKANGPVITSLLIEKQLAMTNWLFVYLKQAVQCLKNSYDDLTQFNQSNKETIGKINKPIEMAIELCKTMNAEKELIGETNGPNPQNLYTLCRVCQGILKISMFTNVLGCKVAILGDDTQENEELSKMCQYVYGTLCEIKKRLESLKVSFANDYISPNHWLERAKLALNVHLCYAASLIRVNAANLGDAVTSINVAIDQAEKEVKKWCNEGNFLQRMASTRIVLHNIKDHLRDKLDNDWTCIVASEHNEKLMTLGSGCHLKSKYESLSDLECCLLINLYEIKEKVERCARFNDAVYHQAVSNDPKWDQINTDTVKEIMSRGKESATCGKAFNANFSNQYEAKNRLLQLTTGSCHEKLPSIIPSRKRKFIFTKEQGEQEELIAQFKQANKMNVETITAIPIGEQIRDFKNMLKNHKAAVAGNWSKVSDVERGEFIALSFICSGLYNSHYNDSDVSVKVRPEEIPEVLKYVSNIYKGT